MTSFLNIESREYFIGTVIDSSRHVKHALVCMELKGDNMQHSGHMGQNFQNELMVEIYFKTLGAVGKVLHRKNYLQHQLKPIKVIKSDFCL